MLGAVGHRVAAFLLPAVTLLMAVDGTTVSTVWYSEFVVVRGQAELPCLVPDPHSESDRPTLVLWYKQDQSQVPIYSYDTRNGPFSAGVRWADETYLGDRAFFRINSDPPTLVIEEVKVSDQDLYTCRVEFKYRANSITKVNLTVIVPAGPPLILDSAGRELRGSVGPLEEGQRAHLTCRSVGGTPEPTLSWWRDGHRIRQSSALGSGEVVESRVSITATRELQDATLSCQALNNNITEPSTTSLTVAVLLRPVAVEIVRQERHLSAGQEVELVCAARGSRPAARITWWRGDVQLPDVQHTVMNNGNLTTGTIKIVPSVDDNGQGYTCRAVNPEISHTPLQDTTTLTVLYQPEAALSLGKPLRAEHIKEGDDVYFECIIRANPEVQTISWYHNGELLVPQKWTRLIISGRDLVLQKVDRTRAGRYTCAAHNSQGRGVSNAVNLNIMYKPVCAAPFRRTLGVMRQESAKVICEVEAFPPQVNFTWKFNGSSEGEALPLDSIENHGTISALNYTAAIEQDFGTLLCWATNKIGRQRKPCVIHLIPQTLAPSFPPPPSNCSIANQSSVAIAVVCSQPPPGEEGEDRRYVMEAWGQDALLQNTTREVPEWEVRGLRAGVGVRLVLWATDRRGRSPTVTLEADIMKVAEKRMGPPEDISVPPVIGAVVGGVGALVVLIIAGLILARYAPRCCASRSVRDQLPHTPPPQPCSKKASSAGRGVETSNCLVSHTQETDLCSSLILINKDKKHSGAISGSSNYKNYSSDRDGTEEIRSYCEKSSDNPIGQPFRERRGSTNVSREINTSCNNPDLVRGTDPSHNGGGRPVESFAILQGHRPGVTTAPPKGEDGAKVLEGEVGCIAARRREQADREEYNGEAGYPHAESHHLSNPSLYTPPEIFQLTAVKHQSNSPANFSHNSQSNPHQYQFLHGHLISASKSYERGHLISASKSYERESPQFPDSRFNMQGVDPTMTNIRLSNSNCLAKAVTRQTSHEEGSNCLESSRSMMQSSSGLASSSSLHDLSQHCPTVTQSPPCRRPNPTNLSRSSRDPGMEFPPSGTRLFSVQQKDSWGTSCVPVTHYATLGRKPILKNSSLNPISIKSGLGDFLSSKHQESAV